MKYSIKNITRLKKIWIILFIILAVFAADRMFPPPPLKSYSQEIYSSDGVLLTAYLTPDDKWRLKTNLESVSPDLIRAILEKEDNWFYWHLGVNPISIIRAGVQNLLSGKRVSGASTITMQVVRMLEPAERNYWNKFIEIVRAVQLELRYSKRDILEIYLSMLPFGGNIEGVKSASYIYFNRSPQNLSLAQSITLAVIPNDPNKLRLDKTVADVIKKRNRWIRKFKSKSTFKAADLENALYEPLNTARYAIPSFAPHFCRRIHRSFNEDIVNSSLNLQPQKKAESLLYNNVKRVYGKGVTNGAVIVIENSSSKVIAYCGSADYYNADNSGQVDGITSVRSPGSALKPALYTLAFNQGILTPQMRLLDIPTDFGGYEPENYDLKFNGSVTAEYALINSLNVPAVRLLQKTGFVNFLDLLIYTGFDQIAKSKKKLGLSLVLGGCGVTLEQLSRMYTIFADNGRFKSLNYLDENDPSNKGGVIFSDGAAYITAEILSENERPDFPNVLLDDTKLPKIAWKTGTSYGKRDAWAIGFNPNYTIGVWMGNFNGKGSPYLSGAEMAVPLLFELFNAIDYNGKHKWFSQPESVGIRRVSSETGMLPSRFTGDEINDYYIKNISTNKISNLYKEKYVNLDETIEYCTECLPNTGYMKKGYPVYDPEFTLWLSQHNIKFEKPPPHNANCKARLSDNGPKIISPSAEFEYFIEKGSGDEIMLQAAAEPNVRKLYWYIDGDYYAKCNSGEKLFFKPSEGKNKITCLDDQGRNADIFITVSGY